VALIRLYQITLSPLIGRHCRFYPSCSEYAVEAIIRKGPIIGSLMAAWRILRCNPFCKGGYDPVLPDAPETGARPDAQPAGAPPQGENPPS